MTLAPVGSPAMQPPPSLRARLRTSPEISSTSAPKVPASACPPKNIQDFFFKIKLLFFKRTSVRAVLLLLTPTTCLTCYASCVYAGCHCVMCVCAVEHAFASIKHTHAHTHTTSSKAAHTHTSSHIKHTPTPTQAIPPAAHTHQTDKSPRTSPQKKDKKKTHAHQINK